MSARCRAAIAAIVVCLTFPGAASAAALEVNGLRLDHRTGELLGVGDPTPVLGWKVAGAGPVPSRPRSRSACRQCRGARFRPIPVGLGSRGLARAERRLRGRRAAVARRRGVAGPRLGRTRRRLALERARTVRARPALRLRLGRGEVARAPGAARQRAGHARPRRAGRALRATGRHQARAARHRGRARARVAPAARRAGAGRHHRGRRQPRPGCDGHGLEPVPGRRLEPRRARRRGVDHARLHQPRIQDAVREPVVLVQLDLGAVRHFDRLRLYPRTDLRTDDGKVPNFPADFTVQASATAPDQRTTIATVADQPTPPGPTRRRRCRSSPAPSPRPSRSRAPASTSPASASTRPRSTASGSPTTC